MAKEKLRSEIRGKIQTHHLERLAVVYVRQSTQHQVLNHQESARLQYALHERALSLGWTEDRVLVIDEDQGKSGASIEGRSGFQRLVSEVSLNHVGIILGIEISRLARSCKDWHQLLEICGFFDTLITDSDGIYDPVDYNDRMLLGLKGTISEAELHMIKQRMNQGRINKARRGELRFRLPAGYLRRPCGEITFDPDEQVQSVIRLIFRKFKEFGTVNAVLQYLVRNEIEIGGRSHVGANKGEVVWRRPIRTTLTQMLKSPLYAGAYSYGKRQIDPRRKRPGYPTSGSVSKPREEWTALLRDQLPAYITWEEHERNLAKLEANRSFSKGFGSPRRGTGLLSGVLVCGWCGRRIAVQYYANRSEPHRYSCDGGYSQYGEKECFSISGPCIDDAVTKELLRAIEPAALELSLEAAAGLDRERSELERVWEQRLERASYEVIHAERQYQAVDPENRLVARELERQWEEKLVNQKMLQEKHRRFQSTQARSLTKVEHEEILRLASDIPTLWSDDETTTQERKMILREAIERVVVDPQGGSERVNVRIEWFGGSATEFEVTRPLARVEQLSYFPQLSQLVRARVASGMPATGIADELNQKGFRPPNCRRVFDAQGVKRVMRKLGLVSKRASARMAQKALTLGKNEWTISALAREIPMPEGTLRCWASQGLVPKRREGRGPKSRWILLADEKGVSELRERRARGAAYYCRRRWAKEVDSKMQKHG